MKVTLVHSSTSLPIMKILENLYYSYAYIRTLVHSSITPNNKNIRKTYIIRTHL
uniref:Uncharacterized protein n=1 Tax=Setaria italica TaxID=4555 RepID=K3ZPF9_SETIT